MKGNLLTTVLLSALALAAAITTGNADPLPQSPQTPAPAPPVEEPTTRVPERRDSERAARDREHLENKCPAPNQGGYIGDPYPLDVCIVTGEKLGDVAVSLVLEGAPTYMNEKRHLRFASDAAKTTFLARPSIYLAELDRRIVALQRPAYPLRFCLVSIDTKLDDTTAIDVVYGNRLYRVSNKVAQTNFVKNLKVYVKAYEGEVAATQRSKYPLKTCVVTGDPLPAKPVDIVVGARLFRLASDEAAKEFFANPGPPIAALEAAYAAAATTKPSGS